MEKEQNLRGQDNEQQNQNTVNKNPATPEEQKIATNPNPRANENIKAAEQDKKTSGGVGAEITDGEAG